MRRRLQLPRVWGAFLSDAIAIQPPSRVPVQRPLAAGARTGGKNQFSSLHLVCQIAASQAGTSEKSRVVLGD
jgi:hypothetical protein